MRQNCTYILPTVLVVDFSSLTTLTLGSLATFKDSFLYEIEDLKLKKNLAKVLTKLPNLDRLTMNGFCDDDILASIVGGFRCCQNLKHLTISNNFQNCPDNQRLTDEGFCDFIDNLKTSSPMLQTLDISDVKVCSVSAKSVIKLKELTTLKSLSISYEPHLEWLEHAIQYYPGDSITNQNVKDLKIDIFSLEKKISVKILLEQILDRIFTNVISLTFLNDWDSNIWSNIHQHQIMELNSLSKSLKSFHGSNPYRIELLDKVFPNLEDLSFNQLNDFKCETRDFVFTRVKKICVKTDEHLDGFTISTKLFEQIPFPMLESVTIHGLKTDKDVKDFLNLLGKRYRCNICQQNGTFVTFTTTKL
jgi:hypothetical protein